MRNQKPQDSMVMTWLSQEPEDAPETGEHVSELDSSASEPEADTSGEDAQSVSGRDV